MKNPRLSRLFLENIDEVRHRWKVMYERSPVQRSYPIHLRESFRCLHHCHLERKTHGRNVLSVLGKLTKGFIVGNRVSIDHGELGAVELSLLGASTQRGAVEALLLQTHKLP